MTNVRAKLFFLILILPVAVQAKATFNCFEGTVGNEHVRFFLSIDGNRAWGTYYYTNVGQIIFLDQDSALSPDSIYLVEHFPNDTTEPSIRLYKTDSSLSGNWSLGSRIVPIELKLSKDPTDYRFFFLQDQDSLKVNVGQGRNANLEASNSFPVPIIMSSTDIPFLCGRIAKYLNCRSASRTDQLPACGQKSIENFLKSSAEKVKKVEEEDKKMGIDEPDPENSYDWTHDQWIYIRCEENDIIDIDDVTNSYSGGAHSNEGLHCHVLDLQKQQELSLQDIFNQDIQTIKHVLFKAIEKRYGHLDRVLFGDLPENFYLTPRGIGFHWTSMGVSSWVDGRTEFFLLFSKLKEYLKPSFKKRMGLNF